MASTRDPGQVPPPDPTRARHSVTLSRRIETTVGRAFQAFTEPADQTRWFTTNAKVDLRVGGRYSNADHDEGEFLLVDPPHGLRFTWENAKHCPGTVVSVRFTPLHANRIEMSLVHDGLETPAHADEMREGWSGALDSFKSYLETGQGNPS